MTVETELIHLADHLAGFPADGRFLRWHFQRIGGGANNLLYHARHADGSAFAFKFTIRDPRRRAWREFLACRACLEAGISVAPLPIWLAEVRYTQPLVVLSWEEGAVSDAMPADDAAWHRLLAPLVQTHLITPQNCSLPLPSAVINFAAPQEGWRNIQEQLTAIPATKHPPALRQLLPALEKHVNAAVVPPAPTALCHVDANIRNLLRRPAGWLLVDWENSGWGDPAFEIVDLMAHPRYLDVPPARWEWVIAAYTAQTGDPDAAARIRATYPVMLVWWVARLARMLVEGRNGRDRRLAPRPPGWEADLQAKLARYAALAAAQLDN